MKTFSNHVAIRAMALCAASCSGASTSSRAKAAPAVAPASAASMRAAAIKPLQWQPLYEPGSGGAMTGLAVSPHDSKRLLIAGDMLGVGLSRDRGESWESTFGFKTWEMADITWHPANLDIVWAGSMSGPYMSTDGGRNWTQKRQGMAPVAGFGYSVPIETVLFDPENANHLLAFGGSSRHWADQGKPLWGVVWESRDGGANWSRLSTITPEGSTLATDIKGDNINGAAFAGKDSLVLYAIADKAGFLASVDGGKTWTRRNVGLPPAGLGRMAVHPTNPNIAWVSVDNYLPENSKTRVAGGVFKTIDGGLTWKNSSRGLGQSVKGDDYNLTSHYRALAVSSRNPNVLYTNDFAYSTGTTYRSDDGGDSWRAIVSKQNLGSDNNDPQKRKAFQLETATPAGMGLSALVIDPKDDRAAYGFNSEYIPRTLDGGLTWNDATAFRPKGKSDWRGRGYSGWVTTNFRFNPYRRGQSVFQAMDAARVWISDDNLTTWRMPLSKPDPWGGGRDVAFARDNRIYATTGTFNFTGLARSVDGGKNWEVLSGKEHGLPQWYQGASPGGVYALPDDSKKVWAVIDNKLMQSLDGGDNWNLVFDRPGLQWIAADAKNPKRFYLSGERNIYQTDDGVNFQAIGGPHNGNSRLAVDSLGRLLVVAHQGERAGLWRYDAKAALASRWTRLVDEYWISSVAVDPSNPNRIAFSTNQNPYTEVSQASGVWLSGDGGKTWSQQNVGLAMTRGSVLAFDPHDPTTLVFGTNGRGFFQTRWPKTLLPIGTRSYMSTPDDAKFAQIRSAPQAPAPKLSNAAMEEGTDAPTGWSLSWTARGKLAITRDTKDFKEGKASLSLATQGDAMGQGSQMFDAAQGTIFTVSGWMKTRGKAKVNFYAQAFDNAYHPVAKDAFQQIGFAQNDIEWTQFKKEITLPEGSAHIGLGLLIEGDGQAWLDDVQFSNVKLPPSEP